MCWICIFMREILPNHLVWVPYISSATVIIGSNINWSSLQIWCHVQKQLWSTCTCTIYVSDIEWQVWYCIQNQICLHEDLNFSLMESLCHDASQNTSDAKMIWFVVLELMSTATFNIWLTISQLTIHCMCVEISIWKY